MHEKSPFAVGDNRPTALGNGGTNMVHGYGPHGVVSGAEIGITLIVIAVSLSAFLWMAYRTRRRTT